MEEEQKISNFITERLEKFASFQDEEHLTNPRKESLLTPQGSSPKAFHYKHLPERTSSTYQVAPQVYEPYEAEQIYPALAGYFAQEKSSTMDGQIHGNQEHFSKKVYRRSSTSVDDYYGKTQWQADKVPDKLKREYRRSVSMSGGVDHGQKEWINSPQRQEDMRFRSSASGDHNYGQKEMMDSPKNGEAMEFQRPVSGIYNFAPNEWIDSPKRREPVEKMQNLESNKAVELSRGQQYYDQRGWGGSHQRKEAMEIRLISPGVQNYAQKEYIGSPKMGEDQRKMRQNVESNKVDGISRAHMFIARSQGGQGEVTPAGKNQESRAANFNGNIGHEKYGSTNVYGHQLKAPYMDAIEAAKLHGGVLIFDYSKN